MSRVHRTPSAGEVHLTPPSTAAVVAAAVGSSSHVVPVLPSSSSASALRARVSVLNPLETLLKDVKCCICLSIARQPTSLPCNHFFCAECLAAQMRQETQTEQAMRKAKSNASLKREMGCPECRHPYTRRTTVADPVIITLADLCERLARQPDVQELRSKGQPTTRQRSAQLPCALGTACRLTPRLPSLPLLCL